MPSAQTLAKLNLTLHVTGRREDGYHHLQSLVAFAEVGDHLTVTPADQLSLTLHGPFAGELEAGEENLVLKAARLLQEATGTRSGAKLALEKNLPPASGIGGGSGDAALTLYLLEKLWDCTLAEDKREHLALRLGADVPACLQSRAGWMEGIGERYTPLSSFPSCAVILINPQQPLPTAPVFTEYKKRATAFSPLEELPSAFASFDALCAYLASRRNDLLPAACHLMPDIEARLTALEALPMVAVARLSGSGATCFGLCETMNAASEAASRLRQIFPHDWIASAALR